MTTTLAQKLIAHYILAIKRVREGKGYEREQIMREMNVNLGICRCASRSFDKLIYGDDWVNSFECDDNGHWFSGTPEDADNKKEAIELLQLRVDRLKTFPGLSTVVS